MSAGELLGLAAFLQPADRLVQDSGERRDDTDYRIDRDAKYEDGYREEHKKHEKG